MAVKPDNYYKILIDRKFEEWATLLAVTGGRMQQDADLFNLVNKHPHVLDVDGHEIANSVSIVLNDPALFASKVETLLGSASEQVEVTCDSKRFDTAYVERFIKAAYKGADKLLIMKGQYPLDPFLDQQNFRRGAEAVFFNFSIEGNELIPYIQPWDTGYFVAINDDKGIQCTGYKTFRSRTLLAGEYPVITEMDAETNNLGTGNDWEVLYILSRETSEVWAGGTQVKQGPNKLGYVPVIYRRVPMGSMLLDRNSIKYHGESGLVLIRDLIPELNKLVSIIQSLNLQELDHALQEKRDKEDLTPKGETIPTADELQKPGTVNETTGGFTSMPIGEIRTQANLLHEMIKDRIDRAGLNVFAGLTSKVTATEIMALMQQQENLVMPRLLNRALLKRDGAEMFIKQTITEAKKRKLSQVTLNEQTWEISKLEGDYQIEFKYLLKDPRNDAARQALATSQRGLIPDRDIRINTLLREDWQADEQQLRWEEAERLSPLIKMNRTRRAVGEAADNGEPGAEQELMMLTLQMIPALKQAMQGDMTPTPQASPTEVKPSQPLMPVMPGGR